MSTGLAPRQTNLLLDNFAADQTGPVNSVIWGFPTGSAEFIPSTIAGAPGTETAPFLPSVSNGVLDLQLQTYNPTALTPGDSFQGSAIFSNRSFSLTIPGAGIAFTAVARLGTVVPGMVGGVFTYGLNSSSTHNEIDFESLTDNAAGTNNQEQTNVYQNAAFNSPGNPASVPDLDLTALHTYTIEWFPSEVLWFIDGTLVRTNTTSVPQGAMQFYLNFWAYDAHGVLQPATSAAAETIYHFFIQSARVDSVADLNTTLTVSGTVANQSTSDASSVPPFKPFQNAAINDLNSGQTEVVTVTLSAPASGKLTSNVGSYNTTTGVYTVSGTVATLTAALDGLVFSPNPDQAAAGQTVTISFAINVTDTAGASATDGTTSVITTETSLTYGLVQSAYQGIQRTIPTAANISPAASQIDAGQTTLATFVNGLISSEQVVYTTLSALVTIDAFYHATPSSALLTTVATATSGTSYATATELHNLGYSDANVWTILGADWGADHSSNFYGLYNQDATGSTSGYTAFINAAYQNEFSTAPSTANLQNLLADIPGLAALLGGGGNVATPIQIMGGLYGYLLYAGQTNSVGIFAASAVAFLRAAANGTVVYGPYFPSGTGASVTGTITTSADTATGIASMDPNTITITSSNQLIDPGMGDYTINFLGSARADSLVLHPGGVDQVSGFDPDTDILDLRSLVTGTGLKLTTDVSALSNYLTVVDQGADAFLQFDPTGQGGGSTVAVLHGLGATIASLDTMLSRGAIQFG